MENSERKIRKVHNNTKLTRQLWTMVKGYQVDIHTYVIGVKGNILYIKDPGSGI